MTTSTGHKYELHIHWSQADKVFIAEVPDLPGCMTHGDSPAEAAAEADVAIGLWIETAREEGRAVPEPRRHQAVV